ncbi:MAG TPA: sterol desaturase family protein [Thermoanaerobaculia bacterium]|nr:sterol desaturase family protein [Thermoanaerobaculia bacterium]
MDQCSPRRDLPGWLAAALIGGAFVAISIAEARRPLRRQRESRTRRTARNFTMAGLTAAALSALQAPFLVPVARRVEDEKLGLLYQLPLGPATRTILGVLLLDYTLWWWHWMNHGIGFFWRFHLVHHVDRDLDASTAIRFHFGEMSLSVFYRMAQVRLLGIDRRATAIWQWLLMISIFFHHSNIRLSPRTERLLVKLLVTPRMHGIHHSDYRDETDSNWSSLLSWWDYLHGTMRLDIPQDDVTIGVPAYQDEASVTLPEIVLLPLHGERSDWVAEDGNEKIERVAPPTRLERWHLEP